MNYIETTLSIMTEQATQNLKLVGLGVDVQFLNTFKESMSIPGELEKVFTDYELKKFGRIESKAGVFAAKEAFFKALGKKVDWHDVWIETLPSGKPVLYSTYIETGKSVQVSISHDSTVALAVVVIEERGCDANNT